MEATTKKQEYENKRDKITEMEGITAQRSGLLPAIGLTT
jgi:hypothetical protein